MRMVAVPLAEGGRLGGRDNSTRPGPATSVYWDTMLPRTADIVIIGAGAIGSSIAYHLSKRGIRDVVDLEAELAAEDLDVLPEIPRRDADMVDAEDAHAQSSGYRGFPAMIS
jgi:NADPH-dependent 2,4-dienoyl-CoA reductase/sulfur reductase-like enzyme